VSNETTRPLAQTLTEGFLLPASVVRRPSPRDAPAQVEDVPAMWEDAKGMVGVVLK
jgi:hypothetical protein